jgi:hypothetical protein
VSASPSTLYQAVPLEIINWDFEQQVGVLPPVGWQLGGLGNMSASVTVSDDTIAPFEGANCISLSTTVQYGGISSIQTYPVVPGQVYSVSAALQSQSGDPAWVILNFFDKNNNLITSPLAGNGVSYAPGVMSTTNGWQYKTQQGTVPFGAVIAQVQIYMAGVSGGVGFFDSVSVTLLSTAISYYLGLITSEYQNSPNFLTLLATLLQPFVDTAICAESIPPAFDLDTAGLLPPSNFPGTFGPTTSQLDVLGVILGASRTLPFTPVGASALTTSAEGPGTAVVVPLNNTTYMAVGDHITFSHAGDTTETQPIISLIQGVSVTVNLAHSHQSGSTVTGIAPSAVLDDVHYNLLLQAKVLFNQFNGYYQGAYSVLWQAWQQLFPGGRIYITDNQNMTATLFLVGAFDSITQQLITNGLIVPRCQGVQFTYSFATLPIFGFGNFNPAFIAGFGTGSGAYPGGNWA